MFGTSRRRIPETSLQRWIIREECNQMDGGCGFRWQKAKETVERSFAPFRWKEWFPGDLSKPNSSLPSTTTSARWPWRRSVNGYLAPVGTQNRFMFGTFEATC